jgi:hypothetical protein
VAVSMFSARSGGTLDTLGYDGSTIRHVMHVEPSGAVDASQALSSAHSSGASDSGSATRGAWASTRGGGAHPRR